MLDLWIDFLIAIALLGSMITDSTHIISEFIAFEAAECSWINEGISTTDA